MLFKSPVSLNTIFFLSRFQLIQIPGIKIFRFDCNLYFANAEQFRDRLYERTGLNPKKLKTKKQKALYKALIQRKREIELAEIEEAAALKKEKVGVSWRYI